MPNKSALGRLILGTLVTLLHQRNGGDMKMHDVTGAPGIIDAIRPMLPAIVLAALTIRLPAFALTAALRVFRPEPMHAIQNG
ncbi:MAG: hypothetical protein V4568_13585 [Pseudomonadota bacterium]